MRVKIEMMGAQMWEICMMAMPLWDEGSTDIGDMHDSNAVPPVYEYDNDKNYKDDRDDNDSDVCL